MVVELHHSDLDLQVTQLKWKVVTAVAVVVNAPIHTAVTGGVVVVAVT